VKNRAAIRKTLQTRDINCTSWGLLAHEAASAASWVPLVRPQAPKAYGRPRVGIDTIVGEGFNGSIALWLYTFRPMGE
jgi:hypothetical protein